MKVKINTKEEIKDLTGKVMIHPSDGKPMTIGGTIAIMLGSARNTQNNPYIFDKMKSYSLALSFMNDEVVALDEADLDKLIKTIETDANYGPGAAGPVLQIIQNAKQEANKIIPVKEK